ncbi:hypothetical protein Q8F55_001554 [Vanrija albida]|uniref:VPS37 C-terminal domain-containing protein n=1 Tax=Vanrija albida TaxID=181172 RepID=A0ABR3QGI7_9TREE
MSTPTHTSAVEAVNKKYSAPLATAERHAARMRALLARQTAELTQASPALRAAKAEWAAARAQRPLSRRRVHAADEELRAAFNRVLAARNREGAVSRILLRAETRVEELRRGKEVELCRLARVHGVSAGEGEAGESESQGGV